MREHLIFFLIVLSMFMMACLLTTESVRKHNPSPTLHPTPTALDYRPETPTPTCEEEYYRGIFTLCMVFNVKMASSGATSFVDCDDLVREAAEKEWHKKDAPGFEWQPEGVSNARSTRKVR